MNESKDLAYQDYKNGMKYKDIAEKYKVSLSTVKSWKTRYKWERKSTRTNTKKVCVQTPIKRDKSKQLKNDIEDIVDNETLTPKQQLFCLYYSKNFNATKAYQKAYECDYKTANSNGSRLLVNDSIKSEIMRLKQGKFSRIALSEDDVLQKYIDIAFADIGDYVDFGIEEAITDSGTYIKNYVRFKDSETVDTSIISEISQGKDGAKVKLSDKLKALDFLYDKIRSDKIEERKLKIQKLKTELENLKGSKEDIDSNAWAKAIMEAHKRRTVQ